mmetsp:Transcript_12265/g.19971  ORF Transcript_12265/g.19971 Transcript_12265/m.19971 type:complete len:351 (+) Transcript_12265:46-1098(+)
MTTYNDRKALHREAVLMGGVNKHNYLSKAYFQAEIDEVHFNSCCETLRNHRNNADFTLVKLIRFLYFPPNQHIKPYQDQLFNILMDFSFWPQRLPSSSLAAEDYPVNKVARTCFWSENHIFMYLSSSHLFAQKCPEHRNSQKFTYETTLLLIYLSCHNKFDGYYEVNSCVYLPYTMSSLLNLYDYSENSEIRRGALKLLKRMIHVLLLVCNRDGISTLTASARQNPRNRVRNFQHNINQVIRLLTGQSADVIKSTAVTCFFLTSSFSPDDFFEEAGAGDAWLSDTWHTHGFRQTRMNHSTADTSELYSAELATVPCSDNEALRSLSELDMVPFYWLVIARTCSASFLLIQ